MSITELLYEAFSNKDWGKVSDAYEQMTGRPLTEEEPENKSENQPSQAGVTGDSDFISSSKRNDSSEVRTEGRAKSESIDVTVRKNSFVDDGTIAPEESVALNPDLGVMSPVARGKRETPEKISVNCSRCNRKDLVLSSLVGNLSTYRCNNCCVNK